MLDQNQQIVLIIILIRINYFHNGFSSEESEPDKEPEKQEESEPEKEPDSVSTLFSSSKLKNKNMIVNNHTLKLQEKKEQ